MSTILDALRKVERERDVSHDRVLDAPTAVLQPRRRMPVWMIAMGVIIGFTIGGVLEWQLAEPPSTEIAALPAAPPPPAIAVPRPPVAPAPGAVAKVEAPANVVPAPGPAVPAAAPPGAPAAESVAIAIPEAAVTAPVVDRAENPRAAADRMLAAIEKEESALEPSPFSVPRDEALQGQAVAPAPVAPAPPAVAARRGAPPPPVAPPNEPLAAVAPPVEAVPEVAVEPIPDVEAPAEPETTPEALVDTGRSPPGAPKVALSFLQWSADPTRRFAFISVDGAATQRVREGEVTSGMTVAAITPNGVQFKREGTTFVIRPRH